MRWVFIVFSFLFADSTARADVIYTFDNSGELIISGASIPVGGFDATITEIAVYTPTAGAYSYSAHLSGDGTISSQNDPDISSIHIFNSFGNTMGPGFCFDNTACTPTSFSSLIPSGAGDVTISLGGQAYGSYYTTVSDPNNELGLYLYSAYAEFSIDLPNGIIATAVPEPSTWVILLVGFAGVGFNWRVSRSRLISAGTSHCA